MFHQIILKSSQVLWFINYVSYISVLYSVPNATLYHSRGRGSLTSFWCGCSFHVGNVSSLFRFMSHCLHCQNLFHFIIYLKKYQKNKKLEKMLLRIHPPNQGYLKAHSLYSNHFFRLVCSIAITTQKKNHIVHWMYVAAACHLFVQSSVHVLLFLWPGLDPCRRH